jgi:hypothetical protein
MIIDSLKPLCVPINSVKLDPKNARLHNERNQATIRKSLETYGQRKPIVVNKDTGIIEAGNGLWSEAKALGWTEIAVVFVEDTPDTAAAYAIVDNRSAELAEWDITQLVETLKSFDAEVLNIVGYEKDELKQLLGELAQQEKANKEETFDAEKAMAEAHDKATDIKPGQIYALGNHRLMCGDSTKRGDVERLMGGELAGAEQKLKCANIVPCYRTPKPSEPHINRLSKHSTR